MNDVSGSLDSSQYYDPDGYRYGSYDSTTASNPEQVSDPAITGAESTSPVEQTAAVTTEPAEGIVARSETPQIEPSIAAFAPDTVALEHKA